MSDRRGEPRVYGFERNWNLIGYGGKTVPKDFETLIEELKVLRNAEDEARKIVENAEKEAEKTIRDAEEQAATMMSETEEDVREATRVMRQEADVSIDSEVDNLEKESISEMKEIRNKASKNIDEAVSYIFNQVLEASAHS